MREKILSLSGHEARGLALGKSTVHYLKKRAREQEPFRIYEPILAKLRK
jgi:hypothetical protein